MSDKNEARFIGARIANMRKAKDLTQEQMAEILKVTPKHISHTESGTSSFSLPCLIKFCKATDCSLDYIIFGNTHDTALSRLPDPIVEILYTGNTKELDRLNRYLDMFLELQDLL